MSFTNEDSHPHHPVRDLSSRTGDCLGMGQPVDPGGFRWRFPFYMGVPSSHHPFVHGIFMDFPWNKPAMETPMQSTSDLTGFHRIPGFHLDEKRTASGSVPQTAVGGATVSKSSWWAVWQARQDHIVTSFPKKRRLKHGKKNVSRIDTAQNRPK